MTAGVIFDLDGVLIDTSSIWHAVMNDAARELDRPEVSADRFDATFGQGTAADVDSFFPGIALAHLDAIYERHFIARIDDVERLPGAHDVLDALRAAGHPIAIATNTVRPLAEQLLQRAGIAARVDAIVTASDVARPKPAPDMLLRALSQLGLDRDHVWFVGDSAYDAAAARDADVQFIGFRRPGDRRIEQLSQLLPLPSITAGRPSARRRPASSP